MKSSNGKIIRILVIFIWDNFSDNVLTSFKLLQDHADQINYKDKYIINFLNSIYG